MPRFGGRSPSNADSKIPWHGFTLISRLPQAGHGAEHVEVQTRGTAPSRLTASRATGDRLAASVAVRVTAGLLDSGAAPQRHRRPKSSTDKDLRSMAQKLRRLNTAPCRPCHLHRQPI